MITLEMGWGMCGQWSWRTGPQYGQVSQWASVSFHQDALQILMR